MALPLITSRMRARYFAEAPADMTSEQAEQRTVVNSDRLLLCRFLLSSARLKKLLAMQKICSRNEELCI